MTANVQIITTAPSESLAREIARLLVVKGLAACVQVSGPVSSFYTWKGSLHEDQEWICIIKSIKENYDAIEASIIDLHSYEVPEIIVSEIVGGYLPYLTWIRESVTGK